MFNCIYDAKSNTTRWYSLTGAVTYMFWNQPEKYSTSSGVCVSKQGVKVLSRHKAY